MPGCAVVNCKNRERNIKKEKGVAFHRFPKDNSIRQIWVRACNIFLTITTSPSLDNLRVCSLHFDDGDYERDLRAEMLNLKPKRMLKPSVIPHLNLPKSQITTNLGRVNAYQVGKLSFHHFSYGQFT